jgi:AcrR family transcriptional regulator
MADITEQGIPRAVAIAWGRHEAPQRGPSRGLSHERIVAAAIEIADEHGLPAVTMQRVAESLGFTTMSLYRYVASKEELLALMQDAAVDTEDLPEVDAADWAASLRRWVQMLRDVYRRRPWVLDIPRSASSVLMPNSMRVADLGLRAMRTLRLSDAEKISVILGISMYAASFVTLERDLGREGEIAFGPGAFEVLAEVVTPERLPDLAPLLFSGGYVGGEPDGTGLDSDFSFGLERWLDGLRVLHEARAATDPAP